jgi:peptidyl-prolyl cis-trans isomerase C
MYAMTRTKMAIAALAAMSLAGYAGAQTAAPKAAAAPAAAPAAAAAPAGKALFPQQQFDLLLKDRLAQGQPDSPELRASIREELNTRELLAREAKKAGLEKNADVKNQMDLASQTILVRAYVADWMKKNPIPDADLRKEYDQIKTQIGDKEYKVRHVLVEKEDEAKDIIVQLQKGGKFDEIAKQRSKDPGSKDRGGDLDWNAPAGFVKPFSDAMVKTQFGWHVILVEDVREAKVPPYDEVKPQLQQRMQAAYLDKYFKELRAKNGV